MLTRCRFVLEVCWRCAGVAPLQHAPMSDPSSTTPTPLRHAPPGTLIAVRLQYARASISGTVCDAPARLMSAHAPVLPTSVESNRRALVDARMASRSATPYQPTV